MGEEEEEELKISTDISSQEALAREFEQWQKTFYDDIRSLFEKGNEQRGDIAFKNWQNRFMRFLDERLPEKKNEYQQLLSKSIRVKTIGVSPLAHFLQSQGGTTDAFITQCIIDARKGYLDEFLSEPIPNKKVETLNAKMAHIPSIFISHSSNDAELAQLLVDLLRTALNIPSKEIRCTSLDGYRLPGGADIDDQIKSEILRSTTLIGLISEKSFDSAYVLFELGARWGTGKNLIPLLAPGMDANKLKGPVIGYNALKCDSNSQIHQLVENVAEQLGLKLENPSSYQNKIDGILMSAKSSS
jgi:hypothetical protein